MADGRSRLDAFLAEVYNFPDRFLQQGIQQAAIQALGLYPAECAITKVIDKIVHHHGGHVDLPSLDISHVHDPVRDTVCQPC